MNGILTGVLWNLWEVVSLVSDPQILTQGLTWRSSEKSLLKNKTSEESTPSLSECCFSVGDSVGILDRTFFIVQDCLDHWRIFRTTPAVPPSGSVVKNLPDNSGNCRRQRFYPWIEKIPWRRAWQPTPVFLTGESHGQRRLVGYSPWGHKESDMTEETACICTTHEHEFPGTHSFHCGNQNIGQPYFKCLLWGFYFLRLKIIGLMGLNIAMQA